MTTPSYVSRTILTAEIGTDLLTQLGSSTGSLTATDNTRIDAVCVRVCDQVHKKLLGLGIELDDIPPAVQDIAVRIAKTQIHKATWNPRGVPTPQLLIQEEADANTELESIAQGMHVVDDRDPARQIGARFTYTDLDVAPSVDNPRQTIAWRMRKLP